MAFFMVVPALAQSRVLQKGTIQTRPSGRWHHVPLPDEKDPDQARLESELQALGYLASTDVPAGVAGVIRHDPARSYSGLNLYVSGHGPEAYLVDMSGKVVHKWFFPFERVWSVEQFPRGSRIRGREYWRRACLFENGDLIANFEYLGLIKINKDSELVWANPCRAHHDFEITESGDIYTVVRKESVLVWEGVPEEVLIDHLMILDADGREKRRFSLPAAIERSEFRRIWHDHPERKRDVFHTNSVRVLRGHTVPSPEFAHGNLLLSMCNLDAIVVVDPRKEEAVWAYRGGFRAQHDPRLLENGHILLFDNKGRKKASSIFEIEPVSGRIAWIYPGNSGQMFYTGTCGSSRRLPNGNTLICESDKGRAFEVTMQKEVVWEFRNPHRQGDKNEYVATLFDLERLDSNFPYAWASGFTPEPGGEEER